MQTVFLTLVALGVSAGVYAEPAIGSAFQEGSFDEAEQEARRLLSLRPTSSEGYSLLAEAAEKRSNDYRARGDAGRALVLAEEAKRNYQQQLDMQSRDSLLLKHTPAALLEEDAKGIRSKANGQL